MFKKVTEKYQKFLIVIAITFLMLGLVSVISGFSQPNYSSEITSVSVQPGIDAVRKITIRNTSVSIGAIQDGLKEALEERQVEEVQESNPEESQEPEQEPQSQPEPIEESAPQPKQRKLTGKALYDSYVHEIVSTRYPNLKEEYIRALIYHESRYDPNCWGKSTNVQGLMQIMPKWHMERARNLGVTDLFDPYGNILVGCDLLSEMTKQCGFEYALNCFAGGTKYANAYKNTTSPYIKALNSFIELEKSGREMDIYGE